MKNRTLKQWVVTAIIAALYTGISLALQPFSYMNIQVRIAEALTILPIFSPLAIIGLTLGCFLTNLAGVFTGANLLGLMDVFIGTFATFIAAWLSYRFRNIRFKEIPVLSFMMPILINAIIIGLELTFVLAPSFTLGLFMIFALEVGLGQSVALWAIGYPLYLSLKRSDLNLF